MSSEERKQYLLTGPDGSRKFAKMRLTQLVDFQNRNPDCKVYVRLHPTALFGVDVATAEQISVVDWPW
jgi:hypothetical protein